MSKQSNWFRTTKTIFKWTKIGLSVILILLIIFHVYYQVVIIFSIPFATVKSFTTLHFTPNPDGSISANYTFSVYPPTLVPIYDYNIHIYMYNQSNDEQLYGGSAHIPIIPSGEGRLVQLILTNYTTIDPNWPFYISFNQSLNLGNLYTISYFIKVDI